MMGVSKWLASDNDVEIHRTVEKIYSSWLSKSGFYLKYSEDSVLSDYAQIIYYCLSGLLHFTFISHAIVIVYPDLGDMFNQIHILSLLLLCFSITFVAIRSKKKIEQIAKLMLHLEMQFEIMTDKNIKYMKKEMEFYKRIIIDIIPKTFMVACFLYIAAGLTASLIDGHFYDNNILRLAPVNTYWPFIGYIIFDFILPNILQAMSMFFSVLYMAGAFIFYLITVLYLRYYLNVTKHRLKNLDSTSKEINKRIQVENVEELGITQTRLIKEIVQHHKIIKKCCEHLNDIISNVMQLIFLSGGIDMGLSVILVLFYEGNVAYKLEAVVLSMMELCIFACICFTADHVGYLSEEVSYSFYSAKWFGWSQDVKKMMIIVMTGSQRAIKFNAGPMFTVDIGMFASLLQSAYSVINLYIATRTS